MGQGGAATVLGGEGTSRAHSLPRTAAPTLPAGTGPRPHRPSWPGPGCRGETPSTRGSVSLRKNLTYFPCKDVGREKPHSETWAGRSHTPRAAPGDGRTWGTSPFPGRCYFSKKPHEHLLLPGGGHLSGHGTLTANTQPAWPRADEPAAERGQAGCRGPPPHPVFLLRVRSRRRSYTLSSTRAASSPGAWRHTSENPTSGDDWASVDGTDELCSLRGAGGRKARKGFPPTCPGSWAAWWLMSYCEEQRGPSKLSSRPSVCFCGCDGRVAGGGVGRRGGALLRSLGLGGAVSSLPCARCPSRTGRSTRGALNVISSYCGVVRSSSGRRLSP